MQEDSKKHLHYYNHIKKQFKRTSHCIFVI